MFRWIIVNYSLTFEVNYPFDKQNTEVSGLSILRMCCACLGERLFMRSLYSAARRVLLSHTLRPFEASLSLDLETSHLFWRGKARTHIFLHSGTLPFMNGKRI